MDGGQFVSFDDDKLMGIKLDYILEDELCGTLFWEITMD
jgi:GH18 family chitinase